jgi:hypothetical protein
VTQAFVIEEETLVSERATNGVRRGRLTTAKETLRETTESLLQFEGEAKFFIEGWLPRIERMQELAACAEVKVLTNALWFDMTTQLAEVDRRRLHDVREAHRLGVDVHPEWLAAALAEVKA